MKIRSVTRARVGKPKGLKRVPKGFHYWGEVRDKKGNIIDGGWFRTKEEFKEWTKTATLRIRKVK